MLSLKHNMLNMIRHAITNIINDNYTLYKGLAYNDNYACVLSLTQY